MNKRIKELITQAGGHWNHGDFNMPSSVEFQEQDIEKFARLIVRECMRQIARQELFSHPEHKWEDKSIGYNEGIRAAIDKIKNHFGVEK